MSRWRSLALLVLAACGRTAVLDGTSPDGGPPEDSGVRLLGSIAFMRAQPSPGWDAGAFSFAAGFVEAAGTPQGSRLCDGPPLGACCHRAAGPWVLSALTGLPPNDAGIPSWAGQCTPAPLANQLLVRLGGAALAVAPTGCEGGPLDGYAGYSSALPALEWQPQQALGMTSSGGTLPTMSADVAAPADFAGVIPPLQVPGGAAFWTLIPRGQDLTLAWAGPPAMLVHVEVSDRVRDAGVVDCLTGDLGEVTLSRSLLLAFDAGDPLSLTLERYNINTLPPPLAGVWISAGVRFDGWAVAQ